MIDGVLTTRAKKIEKRIAVIQVVLSRRTNRVVISTFHISCDIWIDRIDHGGISIRNV